MGRSNYIHIHANRIVGESAKAFLVSVGEGQDEEEVWLPKSQISDWESYNVGDEDLTLSVTEYIAKEKGLEKYEG